MFSKQAWKEIARSLNLSRRHLQIAQGIFDDYTDAAIADNLNLSAHTVHTYCERVYRKLGVTGRVKLVLRVVDEYMVLTHARETKQPPVSANFAAADRPLRRG